MSAFDRLTCCDENATHTTWRFSPIEFLYRWLAMLAYNCKESDANCRKAMGFNVKKAAQVIAFLARERGGSVNFITVVKLAYLADRRFLDLHDLPILDDDFVSMEHGPVNSTTYDYLKGRRVRDKDVWDSFVQTIAQENLVELVRELEEEDFDELNRAEMRVLTEVSKEYEGIAPFDLVNLVHKTCPEWEDVGKLSKPLSYERVFNALGRKNSNDLADHIYELRALDHSLAKAK